MTIIRDISTMYASMFSFVLFLFLFESRYSLKKTLILTLSLMGPLMIGNFVLLFLLGPETMSTLLLITCSLPSLIFFWFLAKHRDGRFFFTFCFADTMVLEIIHITPILDFYLGNTYLFLLVSRLILCPLLAWFVYKWVRPIYMEVQRNVQKGWYLFTVIALIFYIVLSILISTPDHITNRPGQLPAFILLLVLMPVVYLHIFTTLRYQQKAHKMAEHENILLLQATNMRHRIDEFSAAEHKFREERHDFRHKMNTIAELIEKEQYEQLHALVREYSENLPEVQTRSYCSHAVIDAVLCAYLQQAERKGIPVVTQLHFPEVLPVSEAELATVFANAIENAIHACEKLEPHKRFIEVKVLTAPRFMLQVRNRFEGEILFDDNQIPISPHPEHGFGTRSIVTFCEKNGAFPEFKTVDDNFFLRVVFR